METSSCATTSTTLQVLRQRPNSQTVAFSAQAQRAALLLLLLRGALDSGVPCLESGLAGEEDDALATLLGGQSDVKKARRALLPPEPALRATSGSWWASAQVVLGRHRGVLHASLCVLFAMGWVPRKLAMVLLYAALPLYGVVWNGLPLVPSGGGVVHWGGVLAGCVGVGALLYDAIRGLMW